MKQFCWFIVTTFILIEKVSNKMKFYLGSDQAILTDVSDGHYSDEDEELFTKPGLPGIEQKPAESRDRVLSYISNLRGIVLLQKLMLYL